MHQYSDAWTDQSKKIAKLDLMKRHFPTSGETRSHDKSGAAPDCNVWARRAVQREAIPHRHSATYERQSARFRPNEIMRENGRE